MKTIAKVFALLQVLGFSSPAADLVSMRVTKRGMKDSDLYSLGNGIETVAREQDIHLINVSMTSKRPSLHLGAAAATALRQGAVCVAAAGNEGQGCIAHPAATKRFLAVTAYADKSVLAPGAIEWADVSDHVSGSEPDLSRARFSNWGSEADFMAPGVGIVSCFGDSGYAAGSGTSFAAPVITGLAAAVLSRHHSDILKMPKGPDRAARITEALLHRGRD